MSSNARTLNAPNTFDGFTSLFARKSSNWGGKVGPNTYAVVTVDDDGLNAYALRYHNTNVVVLSRNGTYRFDTGGWSTLTTADRMSEACPPGWHISRREGEILLSHRDSGIQYLPGRKWMMTPNTWATGGFDVSGEGLERLALVKLERITAGGGKVRAVERLDGHVIGYYVNGAATPAVDGAYSGARSGHPDSRQILSVLESQGIRPVVVRELSK